MNQEDLMWALNNNVIQYAALDVIEKEPMPEDCKLIETKNLVITPHAAWAPLETRGALLKSFRKICKNGLQEPL